MVQNYSIVIIQFILRFLCKYQFLVTLDSKNGFEITFVCMSISMLLAISQLQHPPNLFWPCLNQTWIAVIFIKYRLRCPLQMGIQLKHFPEMCPFHVFMLEVCKKYCFCKTLTPNHLPFPGPIRTKHVLWVNTLCVYVIKYLWHTSTYLYSTGPRNGKD